MFGLASRAVVAALLCTVAACATRTVPPVLPTAVKYPEFTYPVVPAGLRQAPAADQVDLGWRYLQNDDLRGAQREFTAALKRNPGLYPAQTGTAYVELARREYDDAVRAFDVALKGIPDYVPALVGKGQALLALKRDADALAAFEAALTADPSLVDVRGRVEVLRFRSLQEIIDSGRRAAAAGRLDDARVAYERALATSPETSFLHRELGLVERRRGNAEAALTHLRRAVELDSADAAALVQIGEILEQRQDYAGAETAYRRAAELEPSEDLSARLATIAARAREARLPAEFKAIGTSDQITRGELAALIAVRFESLLRTAPPRQAVMTDTRGHWAAAWITEVARAGVIEPFENHTFQPRTRVRRGDLATAVSRVLALVAARDPALRQRLAERPRIADMSAGHLNYTAAAAAVASGVMPLLEGNRFQVNRAVSGAEALETIERLLKLVGG